MQTFVGAHNPNSGPLEGGCTVPDTGLCTLQMEACLYSLCMASGASAHFIICWLRRVAIGVAHICTDNTRNSLEGKLWAPEAASGKSGLLKAGWLRSHIHQVSQGWNGTSADAPCISEAKMIHVARADNR